jgi:hypothetical protein
MKEVFRIVNQNNIIVWLCNHIAKAALILMLGLKTFTVIQYSGRVSDNKMSCDEWPRDIILLTS